MSELAPILNAPEGRWPTNDLSHLAHADLHHAVQIADRVWWVGHMLEGDNFQCHVYLIEQGDQSVLIDVGAGPSFRYVFSKIEEIIPLSNIRWYVCQHPDPDITGALPLLDQLISRSDAAIITDWRAEALLKHYGLRTPFWRIEDHNWQLELQDRTLQFVMTPYLHFPGAFVTFDHASRTLFSSDLFGGFTETPALVAPDEDYFECMRLFHEHYMPSQDILLHGLSRVERLPINAIAPQHGSIIPPKLVRPIIERLKTLECGLYLMAESETDIHRLSDMNRVLRRSLRSFTNTRDFPDLISALKETVRDLLPVDHIEVYAEIGDETLRFDPLTRYRGVSASTPEDLKRWLLRQADGWDPAQSWLPWPGHKHGALVIPLLSPDMQLMLGAALLVLSEPAPVSELTARVLDRLSTPLGVAVERETLLRGVKAKRQAFYELAIHDPLTGLYNRLYLDEAVKRLFGIHDRGSVPSVVVSMYDLDHFKQVNDQHGHAAGDKVLKAFGKILDDNARNGDLAVRIGGEEMLTVHVCGCDPSEACALPERVRSSIEGHAFGALLDGGSVTVSVGVAARAPGESLKDVMARADASLYRAKSQGRNQVVWHDDKN